MQKAGIVVVKDTGNKQNVMPSPSTEWAKLWQYGIHLEVE